MGGAPSREDGNQGHLGADHLARTVSCWKVVLAGTAARERGNQGPAGCEVHQRRRKAVLLQK